MTYKPLLLQYDLFNCVQAGDTSTVRPKSSVVTLPWLSDKDSLKVTVNGIPSTDYTFTEPNCLELEVVFDINSLPVNVVITRDTQTDALPAEFAPGSAIRAEDLNGNFEYLLELINELKVQ